MRHINSNNAIIQMKYIEIIIVSNKLEINASFLDALIGKNKIIKIKMKIHYFILIIRKYFKRDIK
jgi:hypothetical protein